MPRTYSRMREITPDDNASFERCDAIYVGKAGDLRSSLRGEPGVVLKDLSAGVIYPLRVNVVFATGTTARDIVALYSA